VEIVANPGWSVAIVIFQLIITAAMGALGAWAFKEFAQAPADPIHSDAFWFSLFGLNGAVLAGWAAYGRIAAHIGTGPASKLAFPYWLYVPVVFGGFAAGLTHDQGKSPFSVGSTALGVTLLATAGIAATLAAALGQWQIGRAAARAANAIDPIAIVPPRYPLVVLCLGLLLAMPGFAMAVMIDNGGNPKAYVFVIGVPLIALIVLWWLRKRPKGTMLDDDGITLVGDKILWRDLEAARVIIAGAWFQTRCLQLVFKDAGAIPTRDRDPDIPDEFSPRNAISIEATETYLPSRLLADLVNARIRRYRHELGLAR
jgi:hypothetical protein